MNGPFEAPASWKHRTISPVEHPDLQLLPIPHEQPYTALEFSIQQVGSDGKDKIRRAEDWRRSGHNSTCTMRDQPSHHTLDHFASLALLDHTMWPHHGIHVWGHDHDGAYRQLPLDDPRQAYVLLITPSGPTLWSHNVLRFGSSASVWGYNRFGDAMVAIARILLLCLCPALHYVDDYGRMEPEHHATSGFDSFEQLDGALGYHMKKSKRQPPALQHKIQGVLISIDDQDITLTPCSQRVRGMQEEIHRCLRLEQLEPEQARRMAGNCNFLTGRLLGKDGRAPLKAIYARANSNHSSLDKPTLSLLSLLDIISSCRPMRIPRSPVRHRFSMIYTDAYCLAGERRLRPGQEPPPEWSPLTAALWTTVGGRSSFLMSAHRWLGT